ncbi:MAG: dockerin type I repeat-containing protein [Oscillospiraceae bacterium]|jgi:hypothetical protein|nr:dockerin type I repeat-containing protein [Oscillospiraceae bacterium]
MHRNIKRVLSLALTIALLSSVIPTSAATDTYSDTELARAVTLGFGEYSDTNRVITFSEFFKMLDRLVELCKPSALNEWKTQFANARTSDETMKRAHGMAATAYAAVAAGLNKFQDEKNINEINNKVPAPWDEINTLDWSFFPYYGGDVNHIYNADGSKYDEWYMTAGMYFFSFGRRSYYSGKTLFDYDAVTISMRPTEDFTYEEALLAALRLRDSDDNIYPLTERVPTATSDSALIADAEARKSAILNSVTNVKYCGTAYYVSNAGSDANDGLTPLTPWATLTKVDSCNLQPGDAVFFKRGDIWRDQYTNCREGVTYSAYGTGVKPQFYGSPEDGADADKWRLVDGTENIWVFYKEMKDCGGLVLNNGEVFAEKQRVHWVGNGYSLKPPGYKSNDFSEFTLDKLDNLKFFNDIDYSEEYKSEGYPLHVYGNQNKGALYLRCDEGNPGEIYSSIEFCCDSPTQFIFYAYGASEGFTLDNLCVKYTGHPIGVYGNSTIQYCEIGWVPGMTHTFFENYPIYSGDGIAFAGSDNKILNNYVYEAYDNALMIEMSYNYEGNEEYAEQEVIWQNILVQGNLVEYSSNGFSLINWETEENGNHRFKNITIDDNYFLYSGYGAVAEAKAASNANKDYYSLNLGIDKIPNINDGVYITGNLLYIAADALINSYIPPQYYPSFDGNTYVQHLNGILAYWDNERAVMSQDTLKPPADFTREALGDTAAQLPELPHRPGDANGDGLVNLADVELIYRHYRHKTQLTDYSLIAANVNGGGVDLIDVTMVYQFYRHRLQSFN